MARISPISVQEIKDINPVQLLTCSCNQRAKKYQSSSCLPKDRCCHWDKKLETSSCFLKSRKWYFRISFLLKINELFHSLLSVLGFWVVFCCCCFGPSDSNQWLFLELCPLVWHVVFLPTGEYPQNQQFKKILWKFKIPQRCLCCPLTLLLGETAVSVKSFKALGWKILNDNEGDNLCFRKNWIHLLICCISGSKRSFLVIYRYALKLVALFWNDNV